MAGTKTVTTSTTEAELLALSQAVKESMFTDRMLRELTVELDSPKIIIRCDNTQTVGIVNKEVYKLRTQLKHVDVHKPLAEAGESIERAEAVRRPRSSRVPPSSAPASAPATTSSTRRGLQHLEAHGDTYEPGTRMPRAYQRSILSASSSLDLSDALESYPLDKADEADEDHDSFVPSRAMLGYHTGETQSQIRVRIEESDDEPTSAMPFWDIAEAEEEIEERSQKELVDKGLI
ncbi:hypothetical protein L249_1884 [Ophiocordyceps polyrhachis-furcata BCC 54312]|uniref:Reverse transcriptase Ty1/copia-type domain-containing protein n=1 Tax=Ophiocordyceps polyrhachis-furcata BCC 54312 TaxID=1330021 RepID=A0A367LR11_9HYPO|nr:hypothetical protein L249_1884 [Ophiocordyceps polyrhachis-furcata BCC 54312]